MHFSFYITAWRENNVEHFLNIWKLSVISNRRNHKESLTWVHLYAVINVQGILNVCLLLACSVGNSYCYLRSHVGSVRGSQKGQWELFFSLENPRLFLHRKVFFFFDNISSVFLEQLDKKKKKEADMVCTDTVSSKICMVFWEISLRTWGPIQKDPHSVDYVLHL